jgi:polyferredoxin
MVYHQKKTRLLANIKTHEIYKFINLPIYSVFCGCSARLQTLGELNLDVNREINLKSSPTNTKEQGNKMPSMKINVIMLAVGSFLLGAAWGVIIFTSTWGFGDTLFNPSTSLDVTSFNLIYGCLTFIGVLLIVIGVLNLFWKKPWKNRG